MPSKPAALNRLTSAGFIGSIFQCALTQNTSFLLSSVILHASLSAAVKIQICFVPSSELLLNKGTLIITISLFFPLFEDLWSSVSVVDLYSLV